MSHNNGKKSVRSTVLSNTKISDRFYRMRVKSSGLARESAPGQFVMVRCADATEPLLRRPLGIHRIRPDGIEMLYEVVGKGTELLSQKRSGESIDIIGPLGHGFDIEKLTVDSSRLTVLVGGGIGVAPLLALAEKLFVSSRVRGFAGLDVLIGAKTGSHILCEKEFRSLGCKVAVSTDDGSKGRKGLVTDLLNDPTIQRSNDSTIYACGPTPMLAAVAKIAGANGAECQVSLEERMACGVGVCLGCPVRVRKFASSRVRGPKLTNPRTRELANYSYKMVCKDGPVFDAKEIAW